MKFSLSVIIFISSIATACLHAQEINQFDENGKHHGKWIKYYEKSEIVRYEGQFEHGAPLGEFRYYYQTGNLQTIANYEQNGTVCHTVSFFGNGNKHAEGTYINRKKEGEWKFYDGYHNIIAIDQYKNDEKHGLCKTFLPTGELIEEMNFKNGLAHGEWKRYFKNGKLQIQGLFENDKYEGNFVFYYLSGKKLLTGNYVQSLREGDWLYYDEEGRLIKVVTYSNGSEADKKVFQKEKDSDFIEMKENDLIMKKIATGKHDKEPDNPFMR
jgi:antitoxin component YwqK of YwqJK toxin-antitoxin module